MALMFKRLADNPKCSVCDNEMDLTVIIPPFGSSDGLKVYTCPRCGHSQDYLVHPPASKAA
jgi:DNA-directed RNA polymerase subunit RPC12/RpoP